MTISVDKLSISIISAMKEYTEDITEAINTEVETRSKELLKGIKAHSPVRDKNGGYYKKGWTRKIERNGGNITITAFNKNRGSLVHLLEHGHALRNGGRAGSIKHVSPATEKETAILENNIKSIIKRGG